MAKSKKLLDKDLMYSKIMPSSHVEEDTTEIPISEIVDASEDTAGELRIFSRSEEWRDNTNGEYTINIMENLILEHLDAVILKFRCCRCKPCRRAIAAIALNKLPPKYIAAEPKAAAEQMEQVPAKTIYAALIQAALKVRGNPRH